MRVQYTVHHFQCQGRHQFVFLSVLTSTVEFIDLLAYRYLYSFVADGYAS